MHGLDHLLVKLGDDSVQGQLLKPIQESVWFISELPQGGGVAAAVPLSFACCEGTGQVETLFPHPFTHEGDGVLEIRLLKRFRKGHYGQGGHNGSTWWSSLFSKAGPFERIDLPYPPTSYFWSEDQDEI